jgi:hypothetical protein
MQPLGAHRGHRRRRCSFFDAGCHETEIAGSEKRPERLPPNNASSWRSTLRTESRRRIMKQNFIMSAGFLTPNEGDWELCVWLHTLQS